MSDRRRVEKEIDNIFKGISGEETSDHEGMMDMMDDDYGYGGEIEELQEELSKLRKENSMLFKKLNAIDDRLEKLSSTSNSDLIATLQREIGSIKGDVNRILSMLSVSSRTSSSHLPSADKSASDPLEDRVAAFEAAARAASPAVTISPQVTQTTAISKPSGSKAIVQKPSRASTVASASSRIAPGAPGASNSASVLAPTSPPSDATPAASALDAAADGGAPSWVEVVKRKRRKAEPLSAELIKASSDPMQLLLAKTLTATEGTREIMVTHLSIPLSIKAQYRPYLAWRTVLKTATGMNPLNITLVHPRRAIVFWDVTDTSRKLPIIRALDDKKFLILPSDDGMVDDRHYLRAYLGGYFRLLRQAALTGLSPSSVSWILEKAEEHWRRSHDKVRKQMWIKRIAFDKKDFADGVRVAEGVDPPLDPTQLLYKSDSAEVVLRVTSKRWICDAIYLIREQAEARQMETARSSNPGVVNSMEEG